jgi:divalent metal cation (Fe/Co/Zn/Cd) transporter
VALLIVRAAWRLTVQSARDLLDESLPAEELAWIQGHVQALALPVQGMHGLRSRRAGPFRFIELHLVIAGETTVHESHRIADEVEKAIERRFPRARVTIHVDPQHDE